MSIFTVASVQILLVKRSLLQSSLTSAARDQNQKYDRQRAGEVRRIRNWNFKASPFRTKNHECDGIDHSELRRYRSSTIGADQSRGTNPRAGAGRDHADAVQYTASRRDRFGDADFSGNKSMERRHLAQAAFIQLGGDDHAVEVGFVLKPANVEAVL